MVLRSSRHLRQNAIISHNMDVTWLDRCYQGGEYDIARCAHLLYGVIADERLISVKLSEYLSHEFAAYADHIRSTDAQKAEIMQLISRKLRTSDFKKKVIHEYKNICFVFSTPGQSNIS